MQARGQNDLKLLIKCRSKRSIFAQRRKGGTIAPNSSSPFNALTYANLKIESFFLMNSEIFDLLRFENNVYVDISSSQSDGSDDDKAEQRFIL